MADTKEEKENTINTRQTPLPEKSATTSTHSADRLAKEQNEEQFAVLSGSIHRAGVINAEKNTTTSEQEKKEKATHELLLVLENIQQELGDLYDKLSEIDKKIAKNDLEIEQTKQDIKQLVAVKKEKEKLKEEKEKTETETNKIKEKEEENKKEEEKLKEEKKEREKNGESTNDIDEKLKVCTMKSFENKQKLEELNKRITSINKRLKEIEEKHPNLAKDIKEKIKELEALEEKGLGFEQEKKKILEEIAQLQEEKLNQFKEGSPERTKLQETFNQYEQLYKGQKQNQYALQSTLTEMRRNDEIHCAGADFYKEQLNLVNDPEFHKKNKILDELEALKDRVNSISEKVKQLENTSRSKFLEDNIKDYDSINARHLLTGSLIKDKAIIAAAKWEDVDIAWDAKPHPGHETISYQERDIYVNKDPKNDSHSFYTINEDGDKNWIPSDDKTPQENLETVINILEQAYGDPPKPFYNETSKAGDTLAEKKENRDTFYSSKPNLKKINEMTERLKKEALDAMEPEKISSLFSMDTQDYLDLFQYDNNPNFDLNEPEQPFIGPTQMPTAKV